MSNDLDYQKAVGLMSMTELQWKKTPGQDRIVAEYDSKDRPLFMTAFGLMLADIKDKNGASVPADTKFSFKEGHLVFEGRTLLSYLVNDVGISFNGSAAYRGPSKNP